MTCEHGVVDGGYCYECARKAGIAGTTHKSDCSLLRDPKRFMCDCGFARDAFVRKIVDMGEKLDEEKNVNHPAHYTTGEIECIDAIRAALTPEEFRGFLKGNVIKYTWRERLKGGIESMKKARWYLNKFLEVFG